MSLSYWSYIATGDNRTPDAFTDSEFTEVPNSGDIASTPGNSQISRTFLVNYQYISPFLDALLGYADVTNSGKVTRGELPDNHPTFPNFWAMEASVTGLGHSGQFEATRIAKSKVAKVTAIYKSVDYDILADDETQNNELYRFVSRKQTFASKFYTINNTGMKFVSANGKVVNIQPQKIACIQELVYTWRMIPPNPLDSPFIIPSKLSIEPCIGRVNSSNFDPLYLDGPIGTVLFLGVEPRMIAPRVTQNSPNSNVYWEIEHKFLYINNGKISGRTPSALNDQYAGHNWIWDQANGWWDLITNDGTATGRPLNESADLNTIFTLT